MMMQMLLGYGGGGLQFDSNALYAFSGNGVATDETGNGNSLVHNPGFVTSHKKWASYNASFEVNGVGYELEAPMSTFYELPSCGDHVLLYTHLLVREDSHTLYAFKHLNDRSMFRHLLKVNGVGAKMALAILSGMDTRSFTKCIHNGDADSLIRLPGVGAKQLKD